MLTQALRQAGYVPHRATGVFVPKDGEVAPFNYSDGDVEALIYAQLQSATDVACGSPELAAMATDWPRQYHYAPQRADLLRPLSHLLKGAVLEVGAGCGAISRYLGETAQEVVSLEGSLRRAVIARARCRGLDNLQVVCANAMDFAPMRRFDAVLLIGVLEYSRCFVDAPDPVQAMLEHCRKFLKPDGVLIVAIENQLGLKYLGGAPEDHVNQPFFGINDRYTDKTVVTFGKHELTARLGQAGFAGTRFYYPFPDYKIPTTVVTEEGAHNTSDTMQNVAASFNARTMNLPYRRPFSEERAWPLLLRNRAMDHLANSFLVVARERPITQEDDVIANVGDLSYIYSTARPRQFAKETVLTDTPEGVMVVRRRLYPNLPNHFDILHQVIEDEPALPGSALSRALGAVINNPGWSVQDLTQWAQPWLAYLKAHRIPDGPGADEIFEVPGSFIDCSPGNLMVQDGQKLSGFDFEWQVSESIPASWPLFRGMFYALYNHASVAKPQDQVPRRLIEIVQQTMNGLGVRTTADDVARFIDLEHSFFRASPQGFAAAKLNERAH
jgi:SAM-dependent methyltransferase